jgi:hypothetical protein
MRLTAGELKAAASWEAVLNLSPTDLRWWLLLNETLERFTHCALWDRVVERYQMCLTAGCNGEVCLTCPRQFMTIELVDVCDAPFNIRNRWYEFLGNGPGRAVPGQNFPSCSMIDRGRGFAMFDDLLVPSRIRLYPQFASDIGRSVTIMGNDSNNRWVLTSSGTIEGEKVVLAAPFVDTVTVWAPQVFRQVIKDPTIGFLNVYGYDASLPVPPASPGASDTPMQALAVWEPTETLPDYRRYYLSGTSCCGSRCGSSTDRCNQTTVTVMARLNFIKVSRDTDFLPISNVGALKLGMLSCMLQERLDFAGANTAMYGTFDPVRKRMVGGAIPLLEEELDAYQGAGPIVNLRLDSGSIDRAKIENLV